MITQRLSKLGDWRLSLREDTPYDVRRLIVNNGHVMVTPVRVPVGSCSDATMKALSRFTGRVDRKSNLTLEGPDLAAWLGDADGKGELIKTPLNAGGGAQTLSTWVSAILPSNGVTVGTVTNTGLSSFAHTFNLTNRRAALDYICAVVGAAWRLNPDGTFDAADPALLFPDYTTPDTIVVRRDGGVEPGINGLTVADLDYVLDTTKWTSNVVVAAQGEGGSVSTAEAANGSNPYNGFGGADAIIETLVDSPATTSGNAATVSSAALDLLKDPEFTVRLSTLTYDVTRYVTPGSVMYVYDEDLGLVGDAPHLQDLDASTPTVYYRGRWLAPVPLRVFAITWPIEDGMGVYYRDASGTYTDLTDWYEAETGAVTYEVGAASRSIFEDWIALPTSRIGIGAQEDILERRGRPDAETHLTRAATQSINNAARTAVTWDTETTDTLGLWTSGTDLTIPTGGAGRWLITVNTIFATATVGANSYVDIDLNSGGRIYRNPLETQAGNRGVITVMCRLADADTVTVYVRQASGAANNVQARIEMTRLAF